jgi:hypothetical protein
MAKLIELRDRKVHRETDYWAPVGERPEWRAAMTEHMTRQPAPSE